MLNVYRIAINDILGDEVVAFEFDNEVDALAFAADGGYLFDGERECTAERYDCNGEPVACRMHVRNYLAA